MERLGAAQVFGVEEGTRSPSRKQLLDGGTSVVRLLRKADPRGRAHLPTKREGCRETGKCVCGQRGHKEFGSGLCKI